MVKSWVVVVVVGGPGHYTVISWDFGYSLFPISHLPICFTRRCSIKVGVYGFTVIFQLSLHGPNNISWHNIEQNKYIDKLGNHKSISFILKQHLSHDN